MRCGGPDPIELYFRMFFRLLRLWRWLGCRFWSRFRCSRLRRSFRVRSRLSRSGFGLRFSWSRCWLGSWFGRSRPRSSFRVRSRSSLGFRFRLSFRFSCRRRWSCRSRRCFRRRLRMVRWGYALHWMRLRGGLVSRLRCSASLGRSSRMRNIRFDSRSGFGSYRAMLQLRDIGNRSRHCRVSGHSMIR